MPQWQVSTNSLRGNSIRRARCGWLDLMVLSLEIEPGGIGAVSVHAKTMDLIDATVVAIHHALAEALDHIGCLS